MKRRDALKTLGFFPLAGSPLAALGQTSSINEDPKPKSIWDYQVKHFLIDAHHEFLFIKHNDSKAVAFLEEDTGDLIVARNRDKLSECRPERFSPKEARIVKENETMLLHLEQGSYSVSIGRSELALPRVEYRKINDQYFWRLTINRAGVEFEPCEIPEFAHISYKGPSYGTREYNEWGFNFTNHKTTRNLPFELQVCQGHLPRDKFFHNLPI